MAPGAMPALSLQRSEAGQGGGARLAGVDADGGQVADGLPGRFVVHGDEGVEAGGTRGQATRDGWPQLRPAMTERCGPGTVDQVPSQSGRHYAVGVERLHPDDGGASARTFESTAPVRSTVAAARAPTPTGTTTDVGRGRPAASRRSSTSQNIVE